MTLIGNTNCTCFSRASFREEITGQFHIQGNVKKAEGMRDFIDARNLSTSDDMNIERMT